MGPTYAEHVGRDEEAAEEVSGDSQATEQKQEEQRNWVTAIAHERVVSD